MIPKLKQAVLRNFLTNSGEWNCKSFNFEGWVLEQPEKKPKNISAGRWRTNLPSIICCMKYSWTSCSEGSSPCFGNLCSKHWLKELIFQALEIERFETGNLLRIFFISFKETLSFLFTKWPFYSLIACSLDASSSWAIDLSTPNNFKFVRIIASFIA